MTIREDNDRSRGGDGFKKVVNFLIGKSFRYIARKQRVVSAPAEVLGDLFAEASTEKRVLRLKSFGSLVLSTSGRRFHAISLGS